MTCQCHREYVNLPRPVHRDLIERGQDLWHYLPGTRAKYASAMAWYFRAIEQADGQWVCRRGMTDYDSHAALEDAITHLLAMSADEQPAELFIHRLDGTVSQP